MRTIGAGINCLGGGDILLIRAGTYQEKICCFIPSGTSFANMTQIRGYCTGGVGSGIGCEVVWIIPTSAQINNPLGDGVFFIDAVTAPSDRGDYIAVSDFRMDAINGPIESMCLRSATNFGPVIERVHCQNSAHSAFQIQYGDGQVVRNSTVLGCGRDQDPSAEFDTKGAFIQGFGSNFLIEGNDFRGCRGAALSIAQGGFRNNVIIRNNRFRDIGQAAVQAKIIPDDPDDKVKGAVGISLGEMNNFQIYNNEILNVVTGATQAASTGTGCFHMWGNASNIEFYNNTCHNAPYGITGFWINVRLRNNIISSVAGLIDPTGSGTLTQTNNTVLTPAQASTTFVNIGGQDFHLTSGSPPIGAGMVLTGISSVISGVPIALNIDKDGNSRGTSWDTGVYQFTTTVTVPQELVLAISCDNDVIDDSGKNNNGSLQNGATFNATGKYNQACQLDGTNDNIMIANSSTLNFTTGFTLAAWVKPNAAMTDWRDIITKANPEFDGSYWLSASSSGICGNGGVVGGFLQAGNYINVCYSTPLTTDWTYVAVTYDSTAGTAIARLYLDAKETTTAPASLVLTAGTGAVRIGSWDGTSEFLGGLVDDIRMYNYALPQSAGTNECISAPSITRDMNCPIRPVGGLPPAAFGFKIGSAGSVTIGAGGSIKTGN